jgi:acetyl esterase/lipase
MPNLRPARLSPFPTRRRSARERHRQIGTPELFLGLSVWGAGFTVNAFRPPKIQFLSVPTFAAGWLTSELPVHHLAWQALATAGFVAEGALDEPAGWVGLGITAASWAGLVALAIQGHQAGAVLDEALVEGLGPEYRQRSAQELAAGAAGAASARRRETLRQLAFAFHLRDQRVESITDVPYVPDGGRAHRLDIYRPRDAAAGDRRPVLLYIHGGAWVLGDKREQGLPLMLHLAAKGWVCVTANYRLSPKATFPDHLVDVKRALAWIKEHISQYGGDPSFVAVAGGSAGGHLAALTALTPNEPEYQPGFEIVDTSVDACVPLYGVYDFTNRYKQWDPGFERWLLARSVMKVRMAEDPDAYERASPMSRITEAAPPFFVIHGRNDRLVPVEEARHFVDLMRERSKAPVVYAELPGAQHAFEIFHSLRTSHAVDAIGRFLTAVYADREVGDGEAPAEMAGTLLAPRP